MALIAPGMCRFSIEGTFNGIQPWASVWDMRIDTTGTTINRDEFIFDTAGNCINSWFEHFLPQQWAGMTLNGCSWVDLNSADGSTGNREGTSTAVLPAPGGRAGQDTPWNTSALIRKDISGARGRRRGRSYWPGLLEADSSGSQLLGTFRDSLQVSATNFLAEMNDDSASAANRNVVVVHTTSLDSSGNPLPEPVFVGVSDVLSLTVDITMATQRERMRD